MLTRVPEQGPTGVGQVNSVLRGALQTLRYLAEEGSIDAAYRPQVLPAGTIQPSGGRKRCWGRSLSPVALVGLRASELLPRKAG